MERTYYTINEETARSAHYMMSMREFKEGEQTAEYKSMVDKAYDLADRIAEEKPGEAERAYTLAERYSRKMADYFNKENHIGCMCPSVMISGPANFPTRKKERQVAAWDNNHKYYEEIQGILGKMNNILYGREAIKSGDEDAIEKLEAKLDDLKSNQEKMKAANRAIRMKDTEKGDKKLAEMGYTPEQIKKLREPDFCGRIGYADYILSNNNANIHRIEGRLKQLKAAKENGTQEQECEFFKAVENTEIMRLQLFFDGKPDSDVRGIVKGNGFKWSPNNGCWQRQLTGNARYALERVIKGLQELKAAQE